MHASAGCSRPHLRMLAGRWVAPPLAVIALALGGCGGESARDTSNAASDRPTASGEGENAADRRRRAVEAGRAAAKKTGDLAKEDPVSVPPKKLGILVVYANNETAIDMRDAVKAASAVLGWQTLDCDAEGNPARMATCAESLLNQNVDALVSMTTESAPIAKQLARAKAAGIPTISFGGNVTPNPLFTVQYGLDETKLSHLVNRYLIEQLEQAGDEPTIALQSFPHVYLGKQREEALRQDVAETGVEIVDMHQSDLANVADDARRATESQLTANPELDAIWVGVNFGFPHVGQVVSSRNGGKSFPERPLVVGFVDDSINLDALRKGWGDAVATHPYSPQGWIVVDQLAERFARERPFEPDAMQRSEELYGLDFFEASLVTQDTVPPAPQRVPLPEDPEAFFEAKWAQEFGDVK